MEIIECGSRIVTSMGDIEGIVTAATIRFGRVIYEISYFLDGEYKVVWLSDCEFKILDGTKTKVGFVTNDKIKRDGKSRPSVRF